MKRRYWTRATAEDMWFLWSVIEVSFEQEYVYGGIAISFLKWTVGIAWEKTVI